jgi:arylsulfatase A-like enzyme
MHEGPTPNLRRTALAGLALAVAAGSVPGCRPADAPPRQRTNVLLITIDTLRDDHCSFSGYGRETTPHLDRLAAEGARFAQAYAPTATTGPTHATIFTSLYPVAHGVVKNGNVLHDGAATLAETLARAGYRTAGFVSSFVLDAKFGYARGFGHYDDDFDAATATMRLERWQEHEIEGRFDQRAGAATDKALRWLDGGRRTDEPFFLFVHYFDPHAPYVPPGEVSGRFATEGAGALQAQIDAYDGEIAYADREIGRLLDHLQLSGLAGSTLVVVTADHGEGLMQHGHMNHGAQIYEEAVRVPLLFRLPGRIGAGTVIEPPVELVDLLPTVLEVLDLPVPQGAQGRDLGQALLGGAALDPGRPVYLHRRHYEPQQLGGLWVAGEKFGIRAGTWKYIAGEAGRADELYDLGADPGETVNLYDADPRRASALRGELDRWLSAHRRETPAQPDPIPDDVKALRHLGYVDD